MKLEGNPVEEHLQTLMNLLPERFNNNIFGIQTVFADDSGVAGLFCGKLTESFELACRCASRLFGIETKNRYDLLLAEVRPPLDGSLYQLQKSLENCRLAVADDGTVILFSPCRDGIGVIDFYNLADRWTRDGDLTPNDSAIFGRHKLSRVYDISRRMNVRLYSELNDGVSDKVFFKTERSPQKTINNLSDSKRDLKVCLVHDAGHTVLINRT
jgi:nickel-dependent lactate racemase